MATEVDLSGKKDVSGQIADSIFVRSRSPLININSSSSHLLADDTVQLINT